MREEEGRADKAVCVQSGRGRAADAALSLFLSSLPCASARAPGVAAPLLGDAIDARADLAGLTLRRPHDRGCVVDWALARSLWARAFAAALPGASTIPPGARLVVTSPPLAPLQVLAATLDAAFGEFGFSAVAAVPSAELAARAWAADEADAAADAHRPPHDAAVAVAALVVDVGFSATTAAAVFDGRLIPSTVARVDLGGKALTNVLKDAVSLRSIDVRGETAAVAEMKDVASFVSLDLASDLAAAKRGDFTLDWVLPDGLANARGFGRARGPRAATAGNPLPDPPPPAAKETIVPLTLERFMIPEALFHPADVGLAQGGVAEAAARALAAAHPRLRPLLATNVLCVGAGAACPGFVARLQAELRPLVPDDFGLAVRAAADPATAAWRGGALLASSPDFWGRAVGRAEWERGSVGGWAAAPRR